MIDEREKEKMKSGFLGDEVCCLLSWELFCCAFSLVDRIGRSLDVEATLALGDFLSDDLYGLVEDVDSLLLRLALVHQSVDGRAQEVDLDGLTRRKDLSSDQRGLDGIDTLARKASDLDFGLDLDGSL